MKLVAFFFVLLLAGTTVFPPLVVASETCVSHGIAYNCVTESIKETSRDVPYQDGSFGGVPVNTTETVFSATWPQNLTTPAGNAYSDITGGVQIGSVHELRATLYSLNATTAPPSSQTIVKFGTAVADTVVPVWSQRMRFPPTSIMNGASVFVWRSPLIWDNDSYLAHSVVFRDADTNAILGGDTLTPAAGIDGGEGALVNGRAYHVIEMPLRSGRNWTVTEYVKLAPSSPGLSHVEVALANGADLANDGNKEGFYFPGTSAGFSFPNEEAGWSAVFLRGIGAAGIERLVLGDDALLWNEIGTTSFGGTGANPNTIEITLPLRTSTPLDIEVQVRVKNHTGTSFGVYTTWLHGVTGISIANFTIGQTGESGQNEYDIGYGWNLTTGNATTYLQYDSTTLSSHVFYSCPSYTNLTAPPPLPTDTTCHTYFPMFTPWVEVHESTVASPPPSGTASDHSFKLGQFLIGVGELIAGAALVLVGGALFLTSETGIGFVAAVAAEAGGLALLTNGVFRVQYGLGLITDEEFENAQRALLGGAALVATGACLVTLLVASPLISVPTCVLAGALDLWALKIPIFEILKNALETIGAWLDILLPYLVPLLILATIFLVAPLVFGLPMGGLKWIAIGVLFIPAAIMTAGKPKNWRFYSRVWHLDVPWFTGLIERRLFKMDV